MCGIFGNFDLNDSKIFYDIGKYSETRGKEASGFVSIKNKKEKIEKFPLPFSNKVIKNNILKETTFGENSTFIGHTRLKTHGNEEQDENNQPISSGDFSAVHNGIVVNYKDLINDFELEITSDLDSEIITLLLEKFKRDNNLLDTIKNTLKLLSGEVSIACSVKKGENYFLYTNTGSIYYLLKENKILYFSSEEWITEKIKSKYKYEGKVVKLNPNCGVIINSNYEIIEEFKQECLGEEKNKVLLKNVIESFEKRKIIKPNLFRCGKCILPETVPFIEFDDKDICNYCKGHRKIKYDDFLSLEKILKNENNIVVGFSGGRDSSYGLGYLKEKIDSNFVAVSYDWGMITDLARRNQARVAGKLGVEHVWISADIIQKRKNIKKNLTAWLSKPNLGMVPILMAGDKVWQRELFQAAKNKKTKYIVQFQSPFEHTYFKYGFANIKPLFSSQNTTSETYFRRFNLIGKLAFFYFKNFILNPKYLNSSIFDTLNGLFSFYFKTGNILSLYEYKSYVEEEVNSYLENQFSWECDPSTPTTWRIGDGTAPIYNYIYWLHAGFTENDFYRSNQIREGHIDREQALKMVTLENQPRFDLIKDYCETIDIDYDFVMESLDKVKKNSIVKSWDNESE